MSTTEHAKEYNRIYSRDSGWNAIAGLVNAAEAIILSMLIMRTTGEKDAGVLSIAFATANLLVTIGKFGGRTYQVSDQSSGRTFSDYFITRIMTSIVMLVTVIVYVLYGKIFIGYSLSKYLSVLGMGVIFTVESMEDVFWGFYQKNGRIGLGAKAFIVRWTVIFITFFYILLNKGNLVQAIWTSVGTSILAFLLCTGICFSRYGEKLLTKNFGNVTEIVKGCLPLFITGFISFYIINAPKYAIDRYLTDENQAIYGFIAMPIFAVDLISGFFYQPQIVRMTLEWRNGKTDMIKSIKQQLIVIFAILLFSLAGACFMGTQFLSILYNIDLTGYRIELILLLLGGGGLAVANFSNVVLVIMRKQRNSVWCYGLCSIIAFIVYPFVVKNSGLLGTAVMFFLLMLLLATLLILCMWWEIRKRCWFLSEQKL